MRRTFPFLWVLVTALLIISSHQVSAATWEMVGDAAWADVHSLPEFENTLELMLQSFEEHVVIRLSLKRCLEEAEIEKILQRIYRRNDLVEASLVRMDAVIRFSIGMNTVEFLFQWIESKRRNEEDEGDKKGPPDHFHDIETRNDRAGKDRGHT